MVVVAALGQGQRPFHGFDHFKQRDLDRWAGQPVASADAAQAFDQAGLGQWLEHLADGGRLQAGEFGQFGGTEHLARTGGEHGQYDGGVIGELGDAQHGMRVVLKAD
ncbi:hypothetical protein D3C72_1394320 [compost metagenome]